MQSTPSMVGSYCSRKMFFPYRMTRADFPTPPAACRTPYPAFRKRPQPHSISEHPRQNKKSENRREIRRNIECALTSQDHSGIPLTAGATRETPDARYARAAAWRKGGRSIRYGWGCGRWRSAPSDGRCLRLSVLRHGLRHEPLTCGRETERGLVGLAAEATRGGRGKVCPPVGVEQPAGIERRCQGCVKLMQARNGKWVGARWRWNVKCLGWETR